MSEALIDIYIRSPFCVATAPGEVFEYKAGRIYSVTKSLYDQLKRAGFQHALAGSEDAHLKAEPNKLASEHAVRIAPHPTEETLFKHSKKKLERYLTTQKLKELEAAGVKL
jgi:hypothetical protein